MACGRMRKWTDHLVRLHRAVPGSSAGSAIRCLLTLGGLVVIGWVLGGAGSAHADTTRTPGSTATSSAVPSAIADGIRRAGDAVRPVRSVASPVDERTARRTGGSPAGTAATPPARAGRLTTVVHAADPVRPAVRTPGAVSLRESIRDLVRTGHTTPSVLPVPDSELLAPGGTFGDLGALDAVAAGRLPGSMTASPAKSDDSRASWRDRRSAAGQGERPKPDDRRPPASGAPESIDDGHPAIRAVTSHPVPGHDPADPDRSASNGTAPMVNGPALSGMGLAYLPPGGLWPRVPSVVAPAVGAVPPPVHSAAGEPSFSPD